MSVYKRNDSPFYHFDFQVRGVRFYGSTEQTSKREAERFEENERKKAIAAHESKKPLRERMPFSQAVGRYWTEVGMHKPSADEIERNLERLVTLVGPATPIVDIDDDMLARLIARRRAATRWGRDGKLVSAATVNRQITQLLRPILLRARKIWKIPLPDMPDWSDHLLDEPTERVRELRTDEEAKIEAAEHDDYRPVRLFAQITGLRLREVVGLTWKQVDFWNMVISVVGKGDKPHVVPITKELKALLWPLREHHPENVFTFAAERTRRCGKTGNRYVKGERYPVTYWGLTTRRKRDFKNAKVEDLKWHDLRHTAATRILRKTGNMKIAQELLGHSDIRTTGKYAHALVDDVRNAMEEVSADEPERKESREKSRDEGSADEKDVKKQKTRNKRPKGL
jgi:integrase